MRLRPLISAAVLVGASACQQNCTEVGCDSSVVVTSDASFATELMPLVATVCASGVCQVTRIDRSGFGPDDRFVTISTRLDIDDARDGDVVVTFEVRVERTGEVLATATGTGHFVRTQPNGAHCEPTCHSAYLTYDGTGHLVA